MLLICPRILILRLLNHNNTQFTNRNIRAFYTCIKNASTGVTAIEDFFNGFVKFGFSGTLVRKIYSYTNPKKNVPVYHINMFTFFVDVFKRFALKLSGDLSFNSSVRKAITGSCHVTVQPTTYAYIHSRIRHRRRAIFYYIFLFFSSPSPKNTIVMECGLTVLVSTPL